ncbi:hypothetical protein GCM10017083_02570 [Thalassobaculum fulvum]|uniref:Protein phosphatase 2C n=1 Tax=Thalassobaculum fulvum TaxID=1633335 RepID=A0A919CME3_9PROT|nr:SpoIIE family protein phosphatase [Thalassobaculum fulvum]GHD39915.1 hypothetical protein GCM10017083_02570 [Thalassobaculum fulvum]
MLRVLDHANDPGKGRDSEDRVGHRAAEGIAWIVDGATDMCATRLFPEAPSDAFWFADAAHDLLRTLPAGAPEAVVAALIDGLRERVEAHTGAPAGRIPPGDMPSAALTRLHVDPASKRMVFASFPDCTAIVLPAAGPARPVAKAPPRLDEQAQARALIAAGAEIPSVLRAQRAMMNRPDGYPVLSVHPAAAARLDLRTEPAAAGTRVLLCTDGFYRLVDMYGLYDDDGLIRAALDGGLAALVGRLRGFEADAAENARFGRFKTSDDAAALLLEIQ